MGGGGLSNEGDFSFFLDAKQAHGVVTEAHRQAVQGWLSGQAAIASATVGPLLDAHREFEQVQ